MSTVDPDRWKVVSPYLDQVLETPEEERAAWLASFHEQNPELAADLQSLLEEHDALAVEGFLEQDLASPALHTAAAGQAIGPYTLVSPIGQGGMGIVWLAERTDGRFQRQAAIKFLAVALAGRGEERFRREGAMLARLTHQHVAHLIDAGLTTAGQPFLVLEYVDGEHLDRYCYTHTLDVAARLRLFLDVLAAVAHAHAHLIVHRDIKPSNVLVTASGQVKLLDFGIAKLLEDDGHLTGATVLTRRGEVALTPQYAAPEQMTGGAVSTATDVYTLGVLLYVLLTGQHPAGSGVRSTADMVKAIVEVEPPRPSDVVTATGADAASVAQASQRATTPERLRRLLRGDLDTIVGKALKKNPRERYESVSAFADDIRRFLADEPISARPDTVTYRLAKFVRRNRAVTALTALVVVASVLGVVGTVLQARTARTQRDFALRQLSRAVTINEFNEFLLSDAAPSGKPFTVNELLGRAEHILARQREGGTNRAELLVSIGLQYSTQDEAASARRVLEKAYTLSRGLSDRSTRATASCALSASLARDGEWPRAETLFQEGLGELQDVPQFAIERNFCYLRGSEVARERGDTQEGVVRARAAQDVLKQSPLASDVLEIHTSLDLAEAYRMAGQNREAATAFEQVAARLSALGRDDTQTAVVLFNNWALALHQLGRPREAEAVYRRAIDISRGGDTLDTVSPMVLNNYAKVLRELDRLAEAASYAERAHAKATQVGHQLVVYQSLMERARIYREQLNLARAEQMHREVEPRLRKALPPGNYSFAVLLVERALVAQLKGETATALDLCDQAAAIVNAAVRAGGQGAEFLPTLLVRRSDIHLQLGNLDKAHADAQQALTLLEASSQPGQLSSALGRAHLALSRARRAQGNLDAMRAEARIALAHLESAVGPDHPQTRIARGLAAAVSAGAPN
jgi:serine/threonine protein kinase/tetratricopeptide (TPR) repeat protein